MFKTIMLATDGTENADRALPYAKALAQEEEGTLIVAHVVERYASHKASGSVTRRLLHVSPCPVLAVSAIAVPAPEPAGREVAYAGGG
ncbi:MAG TPA: universal stress protein [Solirubrobacteraceae bacterium]|nr:universal stress protein [Solirubrobacteraceae bacterium]